MIEVIIPYWGTDSIRLRNLDWVEKGLLRAGLKVTIARPTGVEISKGNVLWPAIRSSEADLVVLHDGDVWCDADVWCDGLWKAIAAVAEGAVWAKPHDQVFRLSEEASDEFLAGRLTGIPPREKLVESSYSGTVGGGIIVGRREIFLDVPVDPRFLGWGQEDQAHGEALWTLHGEPWLGDAPLLHLWHQPQRRLSRGWGSREGKELYRRYHRAIRDPSEMLQLVSEAHSALRSNEPVSHGRQSLV